MTLEFLSKRLASIPEKSARSENARGMPMATSFCLRSNRLCSEKRGRNTRTFFGDPLAVSWVQKRKQGEYENRNRQALHGVISQ